MKLRDAVENIVEQFGLDAMLVKSTLRVLKLCKVIESKIKGQKSQENEEQRRNLDLVNQFLGN